MKKQYRCIVKLGHVGSGKYFEHLIYVQAETMAEALEVAENYKGVKKGHFLKSSASVLQVECMR
jgi:hypothetical protein